MPSDALINFFVNIADVGIMDGISIIESSASLRGNILAGNIFVNRSNSVVNCSSKISFCT